MEFFSLIDFTSAASMKNLQASHICVAPSIQLHTGHSNGSSILGTGGESELVESPDQLQEAELRIQGSLEKHSLPSL